MISMMEGTTSACAENTHGHSMNPIPAWNYLRVRGEYHGGKSTDSARAGTTSACAENTPERLLHFTCNRNYLRVRGEYVTLDSISDAELELPPRARRIPRQQRT